MKARSGFVSNSSSCSFILDPKKYATVYEAAWYMVNRELEHYTEWGSDPSCYLEKAKTNLTDLEKCKELYGEQQAVAFPSTNFATHLVRICLNGKHCIYVYTCNNILWDMDTWNPEGIDLGDLYDGGFNSSYINGKDFYVLGTGKIKTIDKAWNW